MRISLDIPEDHRYIGIVRKTARTLMEHHRNAEQDIADLEVVVGELCANVTRHAKSEAGRYRVEIEHHESHVVLLVMDQGRGFDPKDVLPVGEVRSDGNGELRHGGFGLHLVRALADRVEVQKSQPRGVTVRAEKKLTAPLRACV